MRSYYELSQQMYGGNYYIMADAPALESPSTENFYCMFSEYADFAPNSNMVGLDGGCYMAYNIMAVTAEKDTLINWEEI